MRTAAPPRAPRGLPRLLPGRRLPGGESFAAHLDRLGSLAPSAGPAARERLIDEVERSGLSGRGGGGFPTALKLRAVAGGRGRRVVVANGTEGEPASAKDAALLALHPHLVIDGALAAADAVGADEVILAVSRGAGAVLGPAAAAVRERSVHTGRRICLMAAPERFIMGEETALVSWLSGGPPVPAASPPRPSARGVRGRPTLVQNVETLAHLALVARFGADWFAEVGTDAEPGTTLLTVGGAVARPGVLEVALGTPLGEVIERCGGPSDGVGGILTGGYSGAWLDAPAPMQVPVSAAGLRAAGGSLGAGAILMLPARACGLAETARVARYLAAEGAGQCGPCVFGLSAIAQAAGALAEGRDAHAALHDLRELPAEVEGRGACAHPDGVARLVRSALAAFPGEIERHLRGACVAPGRPPVLPLPARVWAGR